MAVTYNGIMTTVANTDLSNETSATKSPREGDKDLYGFHCFSADAPTATEALAAIPVAGIVVLTITVIFTFITVAIFIEEMVFLAKNFRNHRRRAKTAIVLGVFPAYSVTSLLAIWVPRSALLTDLVASLYFGASLSLFMLLLPDYFGGRKRMLARLSGHFIDFRTPPCCCLLRCISPAKFDRSSFRVVKFLVMQTALVKPLLLLLAAVLWTDGLYSLAAKFQLNPAGIAFYINLLNIISSILGIYGLEVMMRLGREELAEFRIRPKFMCLQLVMILTTILALFVNILSSVGVIPCLAPFTTLGGAARFYNTLVVFLFLPLAWMGRRYYLREPEYAEPPAGEQQKQQEMVDFNKGFDKDSESKALRSEERDLVKADKKKVDEKLPDV